MLEEDFFINGSDDIISTKMLCRKILDDNGRKSSIAEALITVKSNRALKKGLDNNTKKLVLALNNNSKSSDFLAKVGIFVGIVGALATIIGTIFGILSFIYK